MAGLGITIVRTNVGLMDNVDYYVIDLSLKPSSSISWMGIAPVAWDRLGFTDLALFYLRLGWFGFKGLGLTSAFVVCASFIFQLEAMQFCGTRIVGLLMSDGNSVK